MRKISAGQITFFFTLLGLVVLLAVTSANLLARKAWLGDFYGALYLCTLLVFVYVWALVVYRVLLAVLPLPEGFLEPGSRGEFIAQVNALFYLILFNSIVRTEFLPIPLKTFLYACMGCKIGTNSYSPGTLLDPPLTTIGDNCIIGHGATVYAHAIEGSSFSLFRVVMGHNVTVGAGAIIMPDVVIGEGAIVSAGAVVTKGARIGPHEFWGGIPARKIAELGTAPD